MMGRAWNTPRAHVGNLPFPGRVRQDFVELSPASLVGGRDTVPFSIQGSRAWPNLVRGWTCEQCMVAGPVKLSKKYELHPKGNGEPLKSFQAVRGKKI